MAKFLFALQYCQFDYAIAMRLAQLIADVMDPADRAYADFMFSASYSAEIDRAVLRAMGRRFDNVRSFRCTKDISGWPMGPNNQAHETARHFAAMCQTGRWKYDGILLGEPDCVPLNRNFIRLLHQEWNGGARTCLGPWLTNGPAPYQQHINGNAMFGAEFIWRNSQIFRAPDWAGWDAFNCGLLMRHGRASKWIFSDYRHGTPENPWKDCNHLFAPREIYQPHPLFGHGPQSPAWLHGIKCIDQAHACVRERLSCPLITKRSPSVENTNGALIST